jgi:hypothetical protein
MLRIVYTDVMGRAYLSLFCLNHGDHLGHLLFSQAISTGLLSHSDRLELLRAFTTRAQQAYDRGEWDLTDEC